MKRNTTLILCLLMVINIHAQEFTDFFKDKTLRVDYIFTGDAKHQSIYLDELSHLPSWAGRRHHLSELPLEGNGQITMTDLTTRKCIFSASLSATPGRDRDHTTQLITKSNGSFKTYYTSR